MNDAGRERLTRVVLLSLAAGLLFLKQTMPLVLVGIPFSSRLVVTAAGVVLVELAPASGAAGRSLALRLLAVDAAVSLLIEGDLLSFRINRRFLSLLSLPLLPQLPHFTDVIWSALRPSHALLFADIILFAAAAAFIPRRKPQARRTVAAVAAVGVAVVVISGATDPYFRGSTLRNPATAAHLSLVPFHLAGAADAGWAVFHGKYLAEGQLSKLQHWYAQRLARPAPPLFETETRAKFDNLITVQFESLQQWAVPMRVGGAEVMPNLGRLRESGISLEQVYSQVGLGNTADAEWLTLCSLYPADAGIAFLRYTERALNCLPAVLRRRGFDTAAFHGNDLAVYNREEMYITLGFSRRYGRRELIPGTGIKVLPDTLFFERVEPLMERSRFYIHLVTYSSHRPFQVPPQGLPLGALAGTTAGDYLESLHFADAALGGFLDHLRARGQLDRTLVVIFGDHGGLNREDSGVQDLPLPAPRTEADWLFFERHVPVLISGAGLLPPLKPNMRAGQIDVAPTIAGLLGVPVAHTGFLGQDLFHTAPRPVVFWSGNVLDAAHLYLAADRHCFTTSGEPAEAQACEGLASFGQEERQNAQLALDADLVTLLDP